MPNLGRWHLCLPLTLAKNGLILDFSLWRSLPASHWGLSECCCFCISRVRLSFPSLPLPPGLWSCCNLRTSPLADTPPQVTLRDQSFSSQLKKLLIIPTVKGSQLSSVCQTFPSTYSWGKVNIDCKSITSLKPLFCLKNSCEFSSTLSFVFVFVLKQNNSPSEIFKWNWYALKVCYDFMWLSLWHNFIYM